MPLLPTVKTKPVSSIAEHTILVYGAPKIGKSTFCSQSEGALFIATEPGLNSLDVFRVDVTSWEDILNSCAEIAQGNHSFKTIIIDTVDNAYKLCADYICKKHNITHQADLEYGKGYAFVNNEFQRVLNKLAFLPYGLILVSHAKEQEVKTRTGSYGKVTSTLSEGVRKIVVGFVDIILYADIEITDDGNGGQAFNRVLRSKPSIYYEAGDRTGRLPETIPLDWNEFLKAFNNGKKVLATEKSIEKTDQKPQKQGNNGSQKTAAQTVTTATTTQK